MSSTPVHTTTQLGSLLAPTEPRASSAPAIRTDRVLIVIVNYRVPDLTIDCLRSLASEVESHPTTRVTVVDNGSDDGSAKRIRAALDREGWSRWASLLALPVNGGYAAGNNAALDPALRAEEPLPPDLVWLLNPDTIVRRGALSALLDFLSAHPAVGIVGSRLEWADGVQQDSRFRFPTLWSEIDLGLRLGLVSRILRRWQTAPPLVFVDHPIDWVAGASMMVRRAVFERIGFLDEGYFLYYEETDFCRRARDDGWSCWYVPESRVVHLVGRSTGLTDDHAPARRPRYWFDSRRRYFRTHYGRAYAMLTDVAFALAFGLWRIRRRLQGRPDRDPPHLLSDFVRYSILGRQP